MNPRDFLHVLSSQADLLPGDDPYGFRVSAVHVDLIEPGSLGLMGVGALALLLQRRRSC